MKNSDKTQNNNLRLLSEIFPSVPENLFYPLRHLDGDELSKVISYLTSQDDAEVRLYLMSLDENVELEKGIVKNKIESLSDSYNLKALESHSSPNLVIGKKFLQDAHKKFASKCGLEHININDLPTEITDMCWKMPDNLVVKIYRTFLEELGLLGTEKKGNEFQIGDQDNLTMREIIDLEQACHNSIQAQNDLIQSEESLKSQIQSLQLKFSHISLDELKRVFILSNMDYAATVSELHRNGHTSQVLSKTYHLNKEDHHHKNFPVVTPSQIDQIKRQIEREENRIDHLSNQLCYINKKELCFGVEGYYREELSNSKKRLAWFQNQLAMAQVDQKKLLDSEQLDLHGYTISAAIAAIDKTIGELISLRSRGFTQMRYLTIICGRGLHSNKGLPRLKPAVKKHLTHSSIKFSHYSDGAFRVCLNQFKN